jgi:hypothetical protein
LNASGFPLLDRANPSSKPGGDSDPYGHQFVCGQDSLRILGRFQEIQTALVNLHQSFGSDSRTVEQQHLLSDLELRAELSLSSRNAS